MKREAKGEWIVPTLASRKSKDFREREKIGVL
jgi:hypothetical protein